MEAYNLPHHMQVGLLSYALAHPVHTEEDVRVAMRLLGGIDSNLSTLSKGIAEFESDYRDYLHFAPVEEVQVLYDLIEKLPHQPTVSKKEDKRPPRWIEW